MPRKQKKFHILTELLGVISGIILIIISTEVDKYQAILFIMGATTLVVDVYFLIKWSKQKKKKKR